MVKKRAPKYDIYIIARFLEPFILGNVGLRRTHLARRTGLNYSDFQRYLNFLLERGILEFSGEGDALVVITKKGRKLYSDIILPFSEMIDDKRLLGKPNW